MSINIEGRFRIGVSYFALALACVSEAAIAQTPTKSAAATDPITASNDLIIVTGTRRADRTVTESAVPIDVFTTKDLATQASSSIQSILTNLVPSFNQQRNAGLDGTAFVRPPTLRGLPSDQILVLMNGKRVHRSALVQVSGDALNKGSQGADLSQIPSVALGRIEVLRDGASALYGSDAIAGVINLGLRTNDSGFEVNTRYGQTYRGDGKDWQISANAGFKLGDGFINVSGEFNDQGIYSRANDRPNSAALRKLGIAVPYPPTRYGQPKNQSYRFVVNSAVPVGDKGELYFFGNYGYSKQEVDFNYRVPVTTTISPGVIPFTGQPAGPPEEFARSFGKVFLDVIPGLLTDAGRPVYNEAGRTFQVNQFFPNGFVPNYKARSEDFSGVFGYRGETDFGMKFDLSAASGFNRIRYNLDNSINPSLGPASPKNFFIGTLEQRETNFNFDVSYPLDVGIASPLNVAAGLEFRRETYKVGLGQPESYALGPYDGQSILRDGLIVPVTEDIAGGPIGIGEPGFGPSSATDTSRNSYSAYVDVEGDVVEGFTLGVAGRYDRFSDFGSTFNGKVSARWAINDWVALRAAANTGFRAPTPGQSSTASIITSFPNGSTVQISSATVTPGSVIGRFFGSQPLKPEKSTSFSGGVVFTPGGGFNLTIDYYNIRVRDRIAITSDFEVSSAQQTALAGLGVPNAFNLGAVNYFTNGFRTRTQGVDIVASHRATSSFGSFNTSLAVGYNQTKVTERTILEAIDLRRSLNIQGLTPRWRGVLSETWTSGMFDATGRVNYFGKITSYNGQSATGFGVQTFRSDVSFDLEVGATFVERFRVAVGAQNMFNRYPEREKRNLYAQTGAQSSGRIYNDASPLGYMGGFWYLRGQVKF